MDEWTHSPNHSLPHLLESFRPGLSKRVIACDGDPQMVERELIQVGLTPRKAAALTREVIAFDWGKLVNDPNSTAFIYDPIADQLYTGTNHDEIKERLINEFGDGKSPYSVPWVDRGMVQGRKWNGGNVEYYRSNGVDIFDPKLRQRVENAFARSTMARVAQDFDWTNLDQAEQGADASAFGIDERRPYDFKWAFNNVTGEPHIWQVSMGGDGKPVHRTMYTQQGWKRDDLTLGQAWYRPAVRDLAGNTREAALLRILYYPHTGPLTPEPIIEQLVKMFPEATVQVEEFSRGGLWDRGAGTKTSSDPVTEGLIGMLDGWQPEPRTPSTYKVPDQVYQQAIYKHQCPMCRGYLQDRGGIFTCTKCPFEYNANTGTQAGMET